MGNMVFKVKGCNSRIFALSYLDCAASRGVLVHWLCGGKKTDPPSFAVFAKLCCVNYPIRANFILLGRDVHN